MAKKKINRLNKEYYVSDEYGRTDKTLFQKVNELIEVVNQLRQDNQQMKMILKIYEKK